MKIIANVSTKLVLEEGADADEEAIFENKFAYFLKVVDKFETSNDEEETNNISCFFIELIQSISQNPSEKEQQIHVQERIFRYILDNVEKVFNKINNSLGRATSSCMQVLIVILKLIKTQLSAP